jgi:molybdopterin converting factor small subunit
MAVVHFSGALSGLADGVDELTIDAPRVRELLAALVMRFPELQPQLEGMAVAIDGEIHQEAEYEPLHPETEVYFVPKMAGG